MESCDNCKKQSDELYECKSCKMVFCTDCGNTKKPLCNDCNDFEESSQVDGLEDLEM